MELSGAEDMMKWIGFLFLGLSIWLAFDWYFIIRKPLNKELDADEPLLFTTFTPGTLKPYNGSDKPHVFLAVRGKVYDVTKSKHFYGPGGPYSNFAGRDASRGLAKNSFDVEMLTAVNEPIDDLKDLTEEEAQVLNDWQGTFDSKYMVVGELVNEKR